ncbi:hypothetical protein [Vibrio penaeicida]|uniref:DUF4288 domain-containing protein n=1 Tax=Vibrio penaeicida TaxID=104609 RepID=A0AAV5NKQ1_9VIBR|nr:hypothetical protein [Vibrio penaeicida]RTZ22799.1 hypothetical protein EKN09_12280 [Vibrio penaeicida]GLQ70778.1 hypothetical protein GCM10007932_01380 [Vibrio penaeicida]
MKLRLYYANGGNHPVLGQIYHKCQEFSGGSSTARYQRYLANILTCVAQSIDDCDRILAQIKKIETGQDNELEIEGNDVEITLSKAYIQVDIIINDDWVGQKEGRFSFSEFKTVIKAWESFLKLPEKFDSEVVIDL